MMCGLPTVLAVPLNISQINHDQAGAEPSSDRDIPGAAPGEEGEERGNEIRT